MNGEVLPRDHGFPLRLVAPGIAGARNVKWLSRIIISNEESHSLWQTKDFKSFSPNVVDWNSVDFESAPSIQEMPVQSAICEPIEGQIVNLKENQFIKLRGYSWSGGGRKIIRVDVSADKGKNWITAHLQQKDTPRNRTYCWSLWEVSFKQFN
jgi:sulfite oxidase